MYCIFNKLYENIIAGNVLDEDTNLPSVQERMNIEKCMSWYQSLVQNGIITVLCDAYPVKCPNIMKIIKTDNKIILEFEKYDGTIPKAPYCITIDIRQSGSRIYEFCIPFKMLFRKLQNAEEKKK